MVRKSKILTIDAAAQARLQQLQREGRYSQREMTAMVNAEFPDAQISKSSVQRYALSMKELTERMREIDTAARALVGEFGDSLGEKASTLLANSVITLVTDAALKQQNEEVDIEQIRKLARAAKDAIDSKRMDVNVRKAVQQQARELALREAAQRIDSAAQARGLSAEDSGFWRDAVLKGM
ncbi:MAG TPA: phage protein Gp27 family protein [Polyangiaceae bacterium]